MSFQKYAQSISAKMHINQINIYLLVGVSAAAVLVIAFALWQLFSLSSSDDVFVSPGSSESASSSDSSSESESDSQAVLVVHVAGAVQNPGICELSVGDRVNDAIEACGGFLDDAQTDALNLARVLSDGEQIVVPSLSDATDTEASSDASAASGSTSIINGKVNINTASAEELDTLPGVGPSTAQKIIDEREANGPFSSIEDLKRVSGIGDKKYSSLADSICVG